MIVWNLLLELHFIPPSLRFQIINNNLYLSTRFLQFFELVCKLFDLIFDILVFRLSFHMPFSIQPIFGFKHESKTCNNLLSQKLDFHSHLRKRF
ncbi:hypothetical protein Hanom_Chr17g01568371 [Helianthus anomalus]